MTKVIKGQWTQNNDYVTPVGTYTFGEVKHSTPQGKLVRVYGIGWDAPTGQFLSFHQDLDIDNNRKLIEAHHENVVLSSLTPEEVSEPIAESAKESSSEEVDNSLPKVPPVPKAVKKSTK